MGGSTRFVPRAPGWVLVRPSRPARYLFAGRLSRRMLPFSVLPLAYGGLIGSYPDVRVVGCIPFPLGPRQVSSIALQLANLLSSDRVF